MADKDKYNKSHPRSHEHNHLPWMAIALSYSPFVREVLATDLLNLLGGSSNQLDRVPLIGARGQLG
jgi:hypothetical protein